MHLEPREIARRLGILDGAIARLDASGQLARLALSEEEIRQRLYRAHLAYLAVRTGGDHQAAGPGR